MPKYIKLFDSHSLYESYINSSTKILPNISVCIAEDDVHINPWELPHNLIMYLSETKLAETTSDKTSGLHTNKFNANIISHEFENGVGTIEFDDDVTSFGTYTFYGCSGLTSITIPNSVTSIGLSAFEGCSGLTIINLSNSVSTIGGSAFKSCTSLVSLIIPNSVTTIDPYAFYLCSGLTSITIGNGVTTIGDSAFYQCSNLTSVTILATTPPTLNSSYIFINNATGRKIYVPSESVATYKAATNWSIYASDIEAIPSN